MCHREIAKKPDNAHWWLIHLGLTQIELKKYREAAESLDRADEGEEYCPLVQWYKGELQFELKNWTEALGIFQSIHDRSLRLLNSSQYIPSCYESVKKTEEIDNDCRARIGLCHLHLGNKKKAAWWLKQHLRNRRKGRFSIYRASVLRGYIRALEEDGPRDSSK